MEPNNFSDLKVWITGASRGIGKAIAVKLSKTDAELFLSSRNITSDDFSELSNIKKVNYLPCDVSSREDVKNTYTRIKEESDCLNVLINNAGVGYFNDFGSITDEQFDSMMDVNIKGTYFCTKVVMPDMMAKGSGMIINILSVAANTVFKGSSIYSASKAAILMMDRVLRNEIRQFGVKIIDILPGATNTELWNPESRTEFGQRMMMPDDIADVVSSLIELNINNRLLTEEIVIRPLGGDL